LPELESRFVELEQCGHVIPTSMFTMGNVPAVLDGYITLTDAVFSDGHVDAALKRLVAQVASTAAGCIYCSKHNERRAVLLGVDPEKLLAVWDPASAPGTLAPHEIAATEFARRAAQQPSEVDDETFIALRRHFSEEAIVELTAVVSLTAFTNRWNTIMDTDLESVLLDA
jgi:alkylhydroperoxidase family enzyme